MVALTLLHIENLRVSRGGVGIIPSLNLTIERGELVALVGPSGCGKSTLLAAIAGLIPIDGGRVTLEGQGLDGIPTHKRPIGLVPQGDHLFPHLNVEENIEYGLRRHRWEREFRDRRVNELLSLIGLDDLRARRVDQLSGGQIKRITLARALAPRPRLILLDEPLTGLDAELHDRLMVDLAALLRTEDTTAIWVTHDRHEAEQTADRIIEMTSSGEIREIGEQQRSRSSHHVISVPARSTHDLRLRVLRQGTPTDEVDFDGDESAIHLAVDFGGRIIAVSSWFQRPHPSSVGSFGMQLRGMASDPDSRGRGAGSALLRVGVQMASALGCDHVWARARDSALSFYLDHDFEVVGDGYIDSATAIAHHDIIRTL